MIDVIVITAYNGENEISLNKSSVFNQLNVNIVRHIIKSGMNLEEAQTWVFDTARALRNECDFIVKLDADMHFQNNESLSRMLEYCSINHRTTFLVKDYISNTKIFGVHILGSKSIPDIRELHPHRKDYWIETIRGELCYACFVNHAYGASEAQIFHFLKQRLNKALYEGVKSDYWIVILDVVLGSFLRPQINKGIILNIICDFYKYNNKNISMFLVLLYLIPKYCYKKGVKNYHILFSQ